MGEEETKKFESEALLLATPSLPQESPAAEPKTPNHDPFERAFVPLPSEKASPSNSTPISEKIADYGIEKIPGDSTDRDAAWARVETEKRLALIKAWEESAKTKADNKAYKKMSAIGAWENTKRAAVEAQLKQIEEEIEKERAEHVEKIMNKIAKIHKTAEEKRAMVEAKRGEDTLRVDEVAAKYRATGNTPKRLFGCLGC